MESIRELTSKVIKSVALLSVVVSIVFIVFFKSSAVALVIGLLFGVLVSTFSFIDLSQTIQRAVSKPPAQAQSYTVRKYFIRYIINGIVIYVSVVSPHIHIIGTVIGMMLIKVAIMMTNLFNDRQFYKNIFMRKEV